MLNQTLSHYRVLEKIGAGGMGVVYRARDEQLERDVAIKVLPPGSLADDVARKRFRQEALALARLNHPNIATVHEFGSQGDTDFLVTEYIAGTTLDAKLGRGPLSTKDVVDLGAQMMQGLSAAHEQGIVHRDLKPANLRITPDGRLKILDFGLAQLAPHASEQGLTVTLTQSQAVTGTLPYMAPEQLRGEPADARGDIWSAGAVLYEMATGRRPFPQVNQPLLINAILNQPPDEPRKINAGVSSGLDQVILKALDKDPGRRYQTAREFAVDLERLATGTLPIAVVRTRTNYFLLAGIAVVIGALAAGGYFFVHRSRRAAAPGKGPHRRSIAVLGFKNLAGKPELAWLSTALSEMLSTELGQGDQLRTISGESIAQMRANLSLPETDSFSQQTLTRIRENLGSDDVVVGSYIPLADDMIRLDLHLQDTAAGETLASVSEKGNTAQIDELVGRAGAELREKLGVEALSEAESASVRNALPSNPEAARLYSEGLDKLRVFDALAARPLFEKSIALDANHAPTHSALAETWSALGYDEKAKEEAKRALDLSAPFSREQRLLIEGRYQAFTSNWAEASKSYQTLWEFFPDRVDYGLLLAHAQDQTDQMPDAINTIAALRKLPLSKGEAARIDVAEAQLAGSRSDFKLQLASSQRAVQEGTALGASLLTAAALRAESGAWQRMGHPENSRPLIEQAQKLYVSAGDRRGAAICSMLSGDLLRGEGHFDDARKNYEEALVVFRQTGDQHFLRHTLERIGNSFYEQGNLPQAKSYYEQTLSIDLDRKDTSDLASDYGNIANALDGVGDLVGGRKMQEQALAMFEKSGDRRGAASTVGNLGDVMLELGDAESARKYYTESLNRMHEISYLNGQPYALGGLGDASLMQGDVAGAHQHYDEALKIAREAHLDNQAAVIQTGLAVVALEEQRLAEGETLARTAIAEFDKNNVLDNGAWARSVLARNLLAQGKLAEAQTVAAQAVKLSQQTANQSERFEVTLADSAVKEKAGKTADATRQLEAMLATTRKSGFRSYEYQARLALAEIRLRSHAPSAQSDLAALEKDAQEHGLLLVANHARSLLQEN
jgi:tetratricopeptide (TPR) repeat protein/tRNA A-37 threonylcarbamoyl transferase component Bud32